MGGRGRRMNPPAIATLDPDPEMNRPAAFTRRSFVKSLAAGCLTAPLGSFLGGRALAVEPTTDAAAVSGAKTVTLPRFFDCNRYIGPGFPEVPDFPTPAALLEEMDRLNIDRSLLWHTDARTAEPLAGNRCLLNELAKAGAGERLIPAFVVAPSLSAAGDASDAFVDLVYRHDVRAFRYFPRSGGGALEDLDPLMKRLARRNPVLLLDCFETLVRGASLGGIVGFAGRHPSLTLVFTNAMWVHHDRLYELMRARPNIRMETSLVHTYRTVEYVVREFGPERMLFGTGYRSNYGAAIANLMHSPITAAQRDQVAHGNIEDLLHIARPLGRAQTIEGDRLWHRLLRREQLGPLIIDAHCHMGLGAERWDDHDRPDFQGQIDHALKYTNDMGVRSMLIAEHLPYNEGDLDGLTPLEAGLKLYPGRFHGYLSAQAFLADDVSRLPRQLDAIFARGFYVGFKTHTDHWKIPLTDERFIPMWEYAHRHRLPILSHTWTTLYSSPRLLRDIASRHPGAFFLLAHSGNSNRSEIEELMQTSSNVYLEWAGSFVTPENWIPVLDRQGNQRVLYGADGVGWEYRWGHSRMALS